MTDAISRLGGDGPEPSRWSNGPGERYAAHQHGYDKLIVVERGSIRFGLPATGEAIDLVQGDRLELPAGTTHDAVVGPDGVTCLEAHRPAGALGRPRRRAAGSW
jgi:quercetin dioxygenase-like cupin family protein